MGNLEFWLTVAAGVIVMALVWVVSQYSAQREIILSILSGGERTVQGILKKSLGLVSPLTIRVYLSWMTWRGIVSSRSVNGTWNGRQGTFVVFRRRRANRKVREVRPRDTRRLNDPTL